jgi:hypothetical protein
LSSEPAKLIAILYPIKAEENYAFKCVGNGDKMAVYFDMPREITLLMLKVQKKLKLEAQVIQSIV